MVQDVRRSHISPSVSLSSQQEVFDPRAVARHNFPSMLDRLQPLLPDNFSNFLSREILTQNTLARAQI
ncbi:MULTISPECIES: hypothetical protein [unclassified Microcoleus]|uniref:hypothetical protein n=1 Tax=unclassified Microcoleus TaxID=2642155 RepID=UPI002FCF58FE